MTASWQESCDKPGQCVKKQRHHFADKGLSSQSYGLSSMDVKSWTIKKAEHWKIDAFELWCWRRLESPFDSTVNPKKKPIRNIHWKDWCLIWSSNILATWCKWLTHWKRAWLPGKFKGKRRRGRQRVRWLDSITYSTDMNLGELQEMGGIGKSGVLQSMGLQRVWHNLATEKQYTCFVGFHNQTTE